jgi:excisionase family DNA binding protein
MNPKTLISTREIALRLSMNRQTAARLCRTGQLEAYLIGGEFRVSEDALNRFISARKYTPPEMTRKGTPNISADERLRIFDLAVQSTNK